MTVRRLRSRARVRMSREFGAMMPAMSPADPLPHEQPQRSATRWVEFFLLFVVAPLPFLVERSLMRWLMPTLLVFALLSLVYLVRHPKFDRRRLWSFTRLWREVPRIIGLFAIGVAALAGLLAGLILLREAGVIALHENVRWFALPRREPTLWAAIMLGYPIVSVYPQELIYRAFLFHRYRGILTTPRLRIAASAAVFGWVHVVFVSNGPATWLPVGLCVIGGALFAWTYERRGSLAAAWFEHAIYGCAVFTLGLGWLFYGGSVRDLAADLPVP